MSQVVICTLAVRRVLLDLRALFTLKPRLSNGIYGSKKHADDN